MPTLASCFHALSQSCEETVIIFLFQKRTLSIRLYNFPKVLQPEKERLTLNFSCLTPLLELLNYMLTEHRDSNLSQHVGILLELVASFLVLLSQEVDLDGTWIQRNTRREVEK